jgi:nucleotide-binding universal stress UspA family protein
MNPLRAIVTATDFSAPARHAAQRAALLAQASGGALTLMHTVGGSALEDLRRWLSDDSVTGGAIEADARQHLQQLAGELGRSHGLNVESHLSIGNPVEQVVRHADEVDAGLLVTGTRGAGFFRGVVFGSTAERIAKRSSRPVLMVRQLPHEPYRRILVPVDFSEWSRSAIELARQIAPQASLVLMHAVEVPFEGKMRTAGVAEDTVMRYRDTARREAQQRLRELAADAGLDTERVRLSTPSGADPWMLIVQEEQEQDCDLVVIVRALLHVAAGPGAALLLVLPGLHGRDAGRGAVGQPGAAGGVLGADQPLVVPADRLLAPPQADARAARAWRSRHRRRRPGLLAGVLLLGPHRRQLRPRRGAGRGRRIRAHALYLPALVLVLLGALHQERAVPVPLLAAARDGGADAGVGLPALGHHGEGRRVPAGALWPALGAPSAWFWIVGGAGLARCCWAPTSRCSSTT